jgi:peptidoglycan/LPS O-acetylase OafA/YrhL
LLGKKPATAKNGGTIIFLEYFRIYAFIAVFISHKFPQYAHINLNPVNPISHVIDLIYNAFMPTITNGEGGVVIFFFISGYIIANKIDQEAPVEFLIKRIFRIYPLYIFAIFAVDWLLYHTVPDWRVLWPKFTLLGDFFGVQGALAIEWTLRIEVVFYLFAAILAILPSFPQRYKLIVLVLNITTLVCVIMPPFPSWSPNTIGKFNEFFPYLMLGMGLYYYDTRKTSLWAIGLIILVALSQLFAGPMPLLTFFMFFNVMLIRNKVPNYKWVGWISSITYAFYLFHLWLYDYFYQLFTNAWRLPWPTAATIAALVFSCYAAHFLIERPFIWLGRRVTAGLDYAAAGAIFRLRTPRRKPVNTPM